MPRRPPAPIIEENSPSSATWRPASTNSAGMMTLLLAPTMPTKIITIPKRGRSRGSLQSIGADAGAHGESRRRGHRPSGTRGKHPRAEQTWVRTESRTLSARALAQRRSRPICAPAPGPPRIATFPITAFSDETRSTESPATGRVWAAHRPRVYAGCVERGTEHHASDRPVFERALTASSSGCLPWPRRPPHPRSMRRARA